MICEDKYNMAYDELIVNEGFLANDPDDVGGATIFGIASKYWPSQYNLVHDLWFDGKRELALHATKNFYKTQFWNNNYCFLKDTSLAFKLFDLSVNIGKIKLIQIYQKKLNKIGKQYTDYERLIPDGLFGKKTLLATDIISDKCALYCLFIRRIELYYKTRLTYWKHGKGWLRRLDKRYYLS